MKYKNPGISLAISFVSSTLVLLLALYTFNSITKSYQRTIGIERGNKVFFAAESGIEAALYHKNSRTKSSHFDWTAYEHPPGTPCDPDTPSATCERWFDSISVNLDDTGTDTKWRLVSRFIPDHGGDGSFDAADLTYNGEMKQFQTIEIPLSYDGSSVPYLSESQVTTSPGNVAIQFPNEVEDAPGSDTFDFGDNRDYNHSLAEEDMDPDFHKRERVLIDWGVSRFHGTFGIQNFIPHNDLDQPCQYTDPLDPNNITNSALICESELLANGGSTQIIRVDDPAITGNYTPCPSGPGHTDCDLTLNTFMHDGSTNYTIRLESLLPYVHSGDGTKFQSLPFNVLLDNSSDNLAQNKYTIVATVKNGDYEKEISFLIDESTSIGAFNYVIFD